jgi:citronellol/citronellal dehydrogenase
MVNTIFKDNLFSGKTALITGGGTGIGLRTAKELAQLGAKVVIAGRKKEVLIKSAEEINSLGCEAIAIECNIREEESIKKCVSDTLLHTGKIDFLINNAGGQFPSPAEMINKKGWHAVIETNLTGTFFMSQEVFKQSMEKNGGAVVNVIANMWNGFPLMAHTGAARAGVENLTKSLAVEWGKFGIRINSVAPGTIHSSGLDTYDPQYKEFILGFGKNNQAYRLGTEAEVSSVILFLLSPAASFITGTTKVDAGESIYSPLFPPSPNNNFSAFQD